MSISRATSAFVFAYPAWTLATLLSCMILLIYYELALKPKRAKLPVYSNRAGLFASWYDALDYVRDGPGVLKRGYEKYSRYGHFYQLRTSARWVIVVPPRLIEEIRTAAPGELSARVAANEVQQAKFAIKPILEEHKFHFSAIKTHLTRSLEMKINDLLEIDLVFREEVGTPTEWKAVAAARAAHRIATRTANRLLVGAPLCRNEEYLQMSMRYAIDVLQGADKLRSWPDFLKPVVTRMVTRLLSNPILNVMSWAQLHLTRLSSAPPPSTLLGLYSNIHALPPLSSPSTGTQPYLDTLQRPFSGLHSKSVNSVTSSSSSTSSSAFSRTQSLTLFALFEAIDFHFLNLARAVVRENASQEEYHDELLSGLWARIIGPNASTIRKFETSRALLLDVRSKTVHNKGILVEHNGKLLTFKASLEGLRAKLVSPLVRGANATTLTLEDQIKGLGEVRRRQKGKVMERLWGGGERRGSIEGEGEGIIREMN